MDDFSDVRKEIDRIDHDLVELFGRRFDICRQVAHYKKGNNIPMMQEARVEAVKDHYIELAEQHSVSLLFAQKFSTMLLDEACRLEDEIIGS